MDDVSPRLLIITAILGLILLFGGCTVYQATEIVGSGTVGVVEIFGEVQDDVLEPGFCWKSPWISSVTEYSTQIETMDIRTTASSHYEEKQELDTQVSISYRVVGAYAGILHQEARDGRYINLLERYAGESIKATTVQYHIDQLLEKRTEVRDMIHEALQTKIDGDLPGCIEIAEVSIVDFGFDAMIRNAIMEKQRAVQIAQQRENEIATAEAQARIAVAEQQGIADSLRIQAEARAFEREAEARAEANAELMKAEARGEAIRIMGEMLERYPQYLTFRLYDRWNGQTPRVLMGSGSEVIFDLESLVGPDEEREE